MYAKAVGFLRKLEGNVALLFHDDADGVCSAALMIKYL
jgi:single-stranded DNA-specific DHH superfamily exonuclease